MLKDHEKTFKINESDLKMIYLLKNQCSFKY